MRVECYSGYTYAEEPRALVWGSQRHRVARIEQRWRTPDGPAFRILTETGERFDVQYHMQQREWSIRPLTGAEGHDEAPDSRERTLGQGGPGLA